MFVNLLASGVLLVDCTIQIATKPSRKDENTHKERAADASQKIHGGCTNVYVVLLVVPELFLVLSEVFALSRLFSRSSFCALIVRKHVGLTLLTKTQTTSTKELC